MAAADQRRRAAGVDLPGAQRRELRRSARLCRRRRHDWTTRARSTTTSTPTRRRTSRCRSPIRRSRPSSSTRCTCLPFGLVALAWQLGIVAALYGVVRISQRLLPVDDDFAQEPARRDGVDRRRHLARTAAQHLRLRPDQCAAGAGRAVRGLQHAMVAVRAAGRARGRGEADACGQRAVLSRRAPLGDRGVLGGRVLRDDRRVRTGGRRPNPLLLHRTARRRQPGRARSARRSISHGAAASRGSSATTPATGRSWWRRSS